MTDQLIAALAVALAALVAVTCLLCKVPQWPSSSAHGEADDGGEAVSAPRHRQAARASGSELSAPVAAPASPHPLDDDTELNGFPFSLGAFVDPDGMCAWCFQPRSECRHQPREFFIST
ncbi:hypothetical protein B1R94_26125 [Mycolicibacterium litorale]|nr:hypothetical protein B1R94_26125 [Mycolicibacterium litorale]